MSSFWIGGAYGSGFAKDIQRLERAQRRAVQKRGQDQRALEDKVGELRADLDFMSLMLGAVLLRLDDRGVVTREDLRSLMMAVDEFDGSLDGRLDVEALRELIRPFDDLRAVDEVPGDADREPEPESGNGNGNSEPDNGSSGS